MFVMASSFPSVFFFTLSVLNYAASRRSGAMVLHGALWCVSEERIRGS